MESCPVKSVMAGGMGFALGGAFGLFMSSVRHFHSILELSTTPGRYADVDS
jgi:hypothetical protein